MQWFGRKQEESPEEFWTQTAEKRGGKVDFLTFATLLGRAADQILDLPGLLYTVGGTVWFEDFERDNWLSKIMGGRRKFEKTEISFATAEVSDTRLVSRAAAMRCIAGGVPAEKLSAVSALGRILSTPIVMVSLATGVTIFFDMIRRAEFIARCAPAASGSPPRQ